MKRKLAILCVCLCTVVLGVGCTKGQKSNSDVTTEAEESTETKAGAASSGSSNYAKYVTLGDYKGLSITAASREVSDEDVDAYIESSLSASGNVETLQITDRPVALGDTVDINFMGLIDDVAFEGGTADNYSLTIGSGSFIEGFEEGLIGVNPGTEVSLPLKFPENYQSAELAGKDVIFKVTVNNISETVYPELTDELVKTMGEYSTVAEYLASVRELLEKQAADTAKQADISSLLELVVANATISGYPEEEVQAEVDMFVEYYTNYAKYMEMELTDFITQYIGLSEEDFYAVAEENGKTYLAQVMVLSAIADIEKIEITDEDYDRIAQLNNFADKAGLIENSGEEQAAKAVLMEVTKEFLYNNAVIN